MPKFFFSRVFRYGMIYMGLFVSSVLIVYATHYVTAASKAQDLIDENIRFQASSFSQLYREASETEIVADLVDYLDGHQLRRGIYLLENSQGQILVGNAQQWPDVDLSPGQLKFFLVNIDRREGAFSISVRGTVCHLPNGLRLLVGHDYSGVESLLDILKLGIVEGLLMALLMGLVVATIMSLSLSRRLERINRTTVDVMDAGLDVRVPMNGSGDEFDRLARNMNRMLDRIANLLARIEGVVDVIAHDLRSPLNRSKSRLEVGLLTERTASEYQEILSGNIADTDRILSTFNSLMTIGKVRASTDQVGFESMDLAGMLRETAEFYGPLVEDKGQYLVVEASGSTLIRGNSDLLIQTLFNLVDNAIKYSPKGTRIVLKAGRESSICFVEVCDNGPGIPAHFRPQAFDRFARLNSSAAVPGQGLGLSLVQVVVELHGGSAVLLDAAPGLIARLEFPAVGT